MQIFTAFGLGYVGETNLVQDFLGNVQRHLGPGVPQVGGAGPFLTLLLEANLIRLRNEWEEILWLVSF